MWNTGNEAGQHPLLNLQSYIMGNLVTEESADVSSKVPYALEMGIISDEFYQFLAEIETSQILKLRCAPTLTLTEEINSRMRPMEEIYTNYLTPPIPYIKCRSYAYYLMYYWANNNSTREALHIKKGTVVEWQRCNFSLEYVEDLISNIEHQNILTKHGYQALVYRC